MRLLEAYEWNMVMDRHGYDHALFTDSTGRLAIADCSGRTPSQTDDGPLFLMGNIVDIDWDGRPSVPVVDEDGHRSRVGLSAWTVAHLVKHWGFSVKGHSPWDSK